jgi:hypothetical protein
MRFLTYASWLLLTALLTIGSAGETSADKLAASLARVPPGV